MAYVVGPIAWTAFSQAPPPSFSSDQLIELVNRMVNGGIFMETGSPPDMDVYRIWPEFGWCHDYAVTKRHELIMRGFPVTGLQLCICLAHGERHMVLIANGMVMDSLNPKVRPLADLGYTVERMQTKENPDFWEDA